MLPVQHSQRKRAMQQQVYAKYRQGMIIEGITKQVINDADILAYLTGLSQTIHMKPLIAPIVHRSDKFGWAGWIHWETSGAHFYAWEKPVNFFSVVICTRKAFKAQSALEFTQSFFDLDAIEYKEI
jgi:hypothetical protein